MCERIRLIAMAAVLMALPALGQAQTADSKELLRAAISGKLRPLLGDSAAGVVERVQKVREAANLTLKFVPTTVAKTVFGRSAANVAPDCSITQTPAKEPDQGRCVIQVGTPDAPTGAYSMLSFSKTPGLGDIMFLRRPAFDPASTALPRPVRLTDQAAYEGALKFLDLLGVPRSHIPVPPPDAKNPLPVRSLLVGSEQDPGKDATRVAVQKVINFQRAFIVPGGLFEDPATGIPLNHVLAPGEATIAIDDSGVQLAELQGWSDSPMDPNISPAAAKTTDALIDEITDDLYAEGVRKVGSLSVLIALRRGYPNPDDPNPPICPVCGLLQPALRVIISQVGPGIADSSERNFIAPGVVREYDLVGANATLPSR